jgi:hypothetical protein
MLSAGRRSSRSTDLLPDCRDAAEIVPARTVGVAGEHQRIG